MNNNLNSLTIHINLLDKVDSGYVMCSEEDLLHFSECDDKIGMGSKEGINKKVVIEQRSY